MFVDFHGDRMSINTLINPPAGEQGKVQTFFELIKPDILTVPVWLQDVYDTQVDKQLFFLVCFGRDATHPENAVKDTQEVRE